MFGDFQQLHTQLHFTGQMNLTAHTGPSVEIHTSITERTVLGKLEPAERSTSLLQRTPTGFIFCQIELFVCENA